MGELEQRKQSTLRKNPNNHTKWYIKNVAYSIVIMFSVDTVIQTFLRHNGVSNEQIGMFTFAINLTQAISYFLFSFGADKIRRVRTVSSVAFLPAAIFLWGMAVFCAFPSLGREALFYMAMFLGILYNLALGLRNLLEYKLPFLVIDMRNYSKLTSISGFLGGIAGIGASICLSFFSKRFSYRTVMGVCFSLSGILALIVSLMNQGMVLIHPLEEKEQKEISLFQVIRSPSFYQLAVPYFLRGIATGIVGMAALIWIQDINDNAASASVLVTANTVASLFCSLIYTWLAVRISSKKLCYYGSIVMLVAMPLMMLGRQPTVFWCMYFIAYCGMVAVNYAVPVYVSNIVSYQAMGGYTALRMMLTIGGTATANLAVGFLIGNIPSELILLVGGILQFLSGLWIWRYQRKKETSAIVGGD